MRRDVRAPLVERRALSSDASLLYFECPELAEGFRPGQFTMVRIPESGGLLLRRPYSFCDRQLDGGERADRFSLLVKAVGAGTRALAGLPLGTSVDCLGPLGSAFSMPEEGCRPIIVAGGVGIAPFVGFCQSLERHDRRAVVLLGGRSKPDLYLREEFERLRMEVRCSTEDGSFGHRGRVTDLLPEVLDGAERSRLYSCGPSPMLAKVASLAAGRSLPHEVSIERRMGCGMGCCLGCVVFVKVDESRPGEYQRSCTEGPVFDADRIQWDRDPYPL